MARGQGYTPHQRRMIQLAMRLSRNAPERVRLALLMAMAVESNFRHINYGDRDSQGILQQRPSTGWGPYIPGVRGATVDIRQFLNAARRTGRGFRGTPGQLAQAVQRSAFPERYDQRRAQALALLRRFGDGGGRAPAGPARTGQGPDVSALLALLAQGNAQTAAPRLNAPSPQGVLFGLAPPSPETPGLPFGLAPAVTASGKTTFQLDDELKDLRRALLGVV